MVSIQIKGLNKLDGFLRGLPSSLRKELNKNSEQFMEDVKKSALLMAPIDSGELKESIRVFKEKGNKWILEVGSREAIFQEEGFKPHFVFTKGGWFIDKNGNKVRKSKKFWADGFHWVSKNKPFLAPALETNLNKLAKNMSKATNKGIRKAMGGKR